MAYDIGARIGLEGEKQYKQAIREIAESQKVMRSEMGLASAQFEGQEKSVEALTKRHDILERTLYTQKDRIEVLQAALKDAANTFGEADTRTMRWQTQLNDAQAELEKTTHEIKKTDEALQDANSHTIGLGDAVSQLASKLGINLPQGLTTSMNGMGKVKTSTLALAGGFAAVATACVAVIKKLAEMTKASAEYADEILATATITGMSAQKLQEYSYAAELMDVSVETITGSQTKLIRAMSAAQEGSEKQQAAFAALGVQYQNTDGSLRKTEDVFNDVIDALGRKTNATERDALAMDIMGKSAQDLNPLITAGSAAMKELGEEAHETGNILSDEQLSALGSVDDAVQRLTQSVKGAKNEIASQFAPITTEVLSSLSNLVIKFGKDITASGIVPAFAAILKSCMQLVEPIAEIFGLLNNETEDLSGLAAVLQGIAGTLALISDFAGYLTSILRLDLYGAATHLGLNYSSGHSSNYQEWRDDLNKTLYGDTQKKQALSSAQSTGYGQVYDDDLGGYVDYKYWLSKQSGNATGNHNFLGGLTWLNENGPEAVYLPQGTRIFNAQDTRNLGGDTYYITIDAKSVREFNDIVKIAKEAKVKSRK